MDDPTRRCENDTNNGTRLLGAPGPKREPHFFGADRYSIDRSSRQQHERNRRRSFVLTIDRMLTREALQVRQKCIRRLVSSRKFARKALIEECLPSATCFWHVFRYGCERHHRPGRKPIPGRGVLKRKSTHHHFVGHHPSAHRSHVSTLTGATVITNTTLGAFLENICAKRYGRCWFIDQNGQTCGNGNEQVLIFPGVGFFGTLGAEGNRDRRDVSYYFGLALV
jgi:hypothetical protein